MTSFSVANVSRWKPVICHGAYTFEIPAAGFRVCQFDVISSAVLEVWACSEEEVLIAAGAGYLSLKFTINEPTDIEFRWLDREGHASWRTLVEPMTVPRSLEPSYTNIEPRPAGMSAELMRMMRVLELNAEARERGLLRELEKVKRNAQPAPRPEADPKGKPPKEREPSAGGADGEKA